MSNRDDVYLITLKIAKECLSQLTWNAFLYVTFYAIEYNDVSNKYMLLIRVWKMDDEWVEGDELDYSTYDIVRRYGTVPDSVVEVREIIRECFHEFHLSGSHG